MNNIFDELQIKKRQDVIGVVLAGGKSSRMGSDKALLLNDFQNTWLERQYNLLSLHFENTVVSKRKVQNYNEILSSAIFINDEDLVVGPLNGILSVHKKYPTNNLFVLAIDLPEFNSFAVSNILDHFTRNPLSDAVAFRGEYYEPLCTLYSSLLLKRIYNKVIVSQNFNSKLQVILSESNVVSIPKPEQDSILRNCNFPGDLN